jgi:uncharacterized oligopeptide transporter (OPT) family protein
MLGASLRRQIMAQCIGIAAGILIVVPVFILFRRVHDIGAPGSDYPPGGARMEGDGEGRDAGLCHPDRAAAIPDDGSVHTETFWPANAKAMVFATASGLIAGEGVMNVFTAGFDLLRQTCAAGS